MTDNTPAQTSSTPNPIDPTADGMGKLAEGNIFKDGETVQDIISIALTLRSEGGFWTLAVVGRRWSKLKGLSEEDLDKGDHGHDPVAEAYSFLNDRAQEYQSLNRHVTTLASKGDGSIEDLENTGRQIEGAAEANGPLALRGMMDVDITRPTLITVFSPIPTIRFDSKPIQAKTEGTKRIPLDPHCGTPRLWTLPGDALEHPRLLGWLSSFDKDIHPHKLEKHNYHLKLSYWSEDSHGNRVYGDLPIIIDPGNGNGGHSGFP